jgi:eukaryotic-like serine/threonine-protein kinase
MALLSPTLTMSGLLGTEDTHPVSAELAPQADSGFRLAAGDIVGHYSVIGVLGSGGMAEVYRARDQKLGRDVAVKIVRPVATEGAACGSLCSLLMREARTMARLSHPGLMTVHDVGEHGGCVYLAMELIDGVTLREWAQEPRPWSERFRVLLEAGRALAAAHAERIVHRDVKPDNVLVGTNRVVVSDFGLARNLADFDESGYACGCAGGATIYVNLDGRVVGTPHYMSPEQLEGRPADARSDQFSFAVTCWEILHGSLPFRGDDVEELSRAILAQLVVPPPENTEVPAGVTEALRRGLRASESARYVSLQAFLEKLTSAV